MIERMDVLSDLHAYSDASKYPETLKFLGIAKAAGQMGAKGRGLLKSSEFQAALREITARGLSGDKAAPHMRDQLLSNTKHIASLIGDGPTARAVDAAVKAGKTLGEALDPLHQDANLAPQFKLVADAVARIAGDVPVKSAHDLGGLDGRYFPDTREIHIVSDAGHMSPWLVLNEGVHAATVKGLDANPESIRFPHPLLAVRLSGPVSIPLLACCSANDIAKKLLMTF
jgi:hypothetical protein